MPEIVYDLAARFSLESVGVLGAVNGLTSAFKGLQRDATAAEAAVKSLDTQMAMQGMTTAERQAYQYTAALEAQTAAQEKLTAANKAFAGVLVGGALTGAAMMGVNVMKGWVNSAATMQDALTQLGAVAHGTQDQLTALYNQSFNIAGKTQFSAPQIIDMERIMAVHGFSDPTHKLDPRQVIEQAIPYFAQAAEINYRMKGTSYQDTVAALTQQAHMFGNYTGAALQNNVQLATRAGLASGMSPDQQTNVLRYLQPAIKGLHMPSIQAYALAALANQTGLTMNRGGSNVGALFRYMVPGGSKAHQDALNEIQRLGGGQFYDKNGNFTSFANFQRIVAQFEKRAPSDVVRQTDLNNAFKVQGAQAAAALTTPNARKQYANIVKQLEPYDPIKNPTGYASVQQMQIKLNQTLVGQLNTLNTNMGSLSAMMGKDLVPTVLAAAKAFVTLTGGMIALGTQHPWLVKIAADGFLLATAIAGIVGPIILVKSALALLNITGEAVGVSKLADAFKGLASASTLGAVSSGVSGAIASARALASAYLVTTMATIRLTASQIATGVASAAAAAGEIAVGVASRAMAVGEGIATVASAALDLALSPIVLTVGAVAAGVAASVWVWQNWSTVLGAVDGKFGPIVQGVTQAALVFAPFLGVVEAVALAFHNWNDIMHTVQVTWQSLSDTVHKAPQTVGQAAGSILGDIERIFVPGMPQGLLIGGSGGTGTGGGGLPALALAGAAGGGTAHKHYHLHVAPGAITVNSQPHHNEDALAAKVMDALSRQWGHGGQWGTTDPTGLQVGPFGY